MITRPIETIRPGMRVLVDNPEETEALPDADVTPQDWRFVSLQMTTENGGTLHVQLLRPIEWLVTEAVVLIVESKDPQELFVSPAPTNADRGTVDLSLPCLLLGQSVYLDLPEPGAQGPATVTAIRDGTGEVERSHQHYLLLKLCSIAYSTALIASFAASSST